MSEELGPELHDKLNHMIHKVEKKFRGLRLGVSAAVPFMVRGTSGARAELGWGKVPGHPELWGLFVQYEGGQRVSLLHASREVRVAAAKKYSALQQALIEQNKKEAGEVGVAIDEMTKFLGEEQ